MEDHSTSAFGDAHKALESALDEACSTDLSRVDTGELIRLEETLAAASQAAKEVVSQRLRRRTQRALAREDQPEPAETAISQRIFEDLRGTRWRVFAVRRTAPASGRPALPEEYRDGWLAFESKDELRRVAPIPANWTDLPTDELQRLCHHARGAPRRTAPLDDASAG